MRANLSRKTHNKRWICIYMRIAAPISSRDARRLDVDPSRNEGAYCYPMAAHAIDDNNRIWGVERGSLSAQFAALSAGICAGDAGAGLLANPVAPRNFAPKFGVVTEIIGQERLLAAGGSGYPMSTKILSRSSLQASGPGLSSSVLCPSCSHKRPPRNAQLE